MKLFEIEHIIFDLKVSSKDELFSYIAKTLSDMNRITNEIEFKSALIKREKEISTGIGDGIAIPHTKDSTVLFPTVLYIRLKDAIDYDALDQKLVQDIFVIAMPTSYNKEHLVLLSKIANTLLDEHKTKVIKTSINKEEVFETLHKELN